MEIITAGGFQRLRIVVVRCRLNFTSPEMFTIGTARLGSERIEIRRFLLTTRPIFHPWNKKDRNGRQQLVAVPSWNIATPE